MSLEPWAFVAFLNLHAEGTRGSKSVARKGGFRNSALKCGAPFPAPFRNAWRRAVRYIELDRAN